MAETAVTVVECGTQVDIRDCVQADMETRTCASVGVQVEESDFKSHTCVNEKSKFSNGLQLLKQVPSTEQVIEDREEKTPEYRCNYCYGCLLCDRGHPWYSLHGKACPWVLLLMPGYLVLGVVLLPFFILMSIAYCVAAAMD